MISDPKTEDGRGRFTSRPYTDGQWGYLPSYEAANRIKAEIIAEVAASEKAGYDLSFTEVRDLVVTTLEFDPKYVEACLWELLADQRLRGRGKLSVVWADRPYR